MSRVAASLHMDESLFRRNMVLPDRQTFHGRRKNSKKKAGHA